MINSNNFKVFWWALLVIVIGLFLYSRHDSLVAGKPTFFDVIVFLVWVSLCLAPIFREMKFFGFELKKDIDELKKDLGHRLELMQIELQSTIKVSSSNKNQLHVNNNNGPIPAKDSEIPNIKEQITQTLKELGIATQVPTTTSEFLGNEISQVNTELFKVRFSFEKLVNSYARLNGLDPRRMPMHRILRDLQIAEKLPSNLINGVLEVLAICNYAIHGEDISTDQQTFVKDYAPKLFVALKNELESVA